MNVKLLLDTMKIVAYENVKLEASNIITQNV